MAPLRSKLPRRQSGFLLENDIQIFCVFEANFFRNRPKREIRFTQQLARTVEAHSKNLSFGERPNVGAKRPAGDGKQWMTYSFARAFPDYPCE